ncbi:hypothetical protein UNDKW_4193 [Undibacterium sp. KW1]|uniref:hypothetical protein n=1 Tax=Undibacterium sp. KW1 TaxID=2058624 RepID=UPI001331F274|nr:hypothetical protein [Undibacterium sp. KW1]BBB62466.1 hypothetical protein UNDKW_4193 [Undibacterium sp. KW1]
MLQNKTRSILLTVWCLTIFVWLPPIWFYFFQTDYFLGNFRGLQNFKLSAPFLLIIFCWATLLSIPKTRTRKNIIGAGSSLMSLGFVLIYYEVFHHTGGFVILFSGMILLGMVRDESVTDDGKLEA